MLRPDRWVDLQHRAVRALGHRRHHHRRPREQSTALGAVQQRQLQLRVKGGGKPVKQGGQAPGNPHFMWFLAFQGSNWLTIFFLPSACHLLVVEQLHACFSSSSSLHSCAHGGVCCFIKQLMALICSWWRSQ